MAHSDKVLRGMPARKCAGSTRVKTVSGRPASPEVKAFKATGSGETREACSPMGGTGNNDGSDLESRDNIGD